MPEILRHPESEADLDGIWSYIAQDSPNSADRFIDLIEARCRLLAENPMMGRSRSELVPGLRSFPVGNYIIFYIPIEEGIEIVRIVSGNRDIDALFGTSPAV
jgi:toxin ParE1/3/4